MPHLFCFGLGYSARVFAMQRLDDGWRISGTSRTQAGAAAVTALGATGFVFDGRRLDEPLIAAVAEATHILVSIAPDEESDPVLRHSARLAPACANAEWIGYLSTIGVYGNHDGAWIDEQTPAIPASARSGRRLLAEHEWTEFARSIGVPLQIFRLAGIYGPGRSAIDKLRSGTARRLIKDGQVFNRIHVDDIADIVAAGARQPSKSGVFNVCDDLPAPPQDVVAFAAEQLGLPVPPGQAFESADLSPMARSFYSENKRCRNAKLKDMLGVSLRYPTYRE
ncbi:MAG: SDR family oxidoreductase, partial [Hyphomicrobiaceae bacterium]